jgi:predicted HD superfamily hydrolase involved in NAD metabolism
MIAETNVTRWHAASIRTLDIEARLRKALRPDTLSHVYRVAEVARTLAAHHGVDPDKAELAALLHEVAGPYTDDQLLALAEYYEVQPDRIELRVPRLLHGKVGAEILREEWGITDLEILNAVSSHVSGHDQMGSLEKVVFLADKLEPDRDKFYGDLQPVRALALLDMDAAIARLSAWRDRDLPVAPTQPDRFANAEYALADLARATI